MKNIRIFPFSIIAPSPFHRLRIANNQTDGMKHVKMIISFHSGIAFLRSLLSPSKQMQGSVHLFLFVVILSFFILSTNS